jgi:hypothetical protein
MGVRMVFRKTFDHLFQRDNPRSRYDSGLAHSAAQHFPDPAGARDEFFVAADQGADGRGETLREADVYGIDSPGQFPDVYPEGDCGIEDPGAVEVDGNAAALRERNDGGGVVGRQRGAVTAVVGISRQMSRVRGKWMLSARMAASI